MSDAVAILILIAVAVFVLVLLGMLGGAGAVVEFIADLLTGGGDD